MQILNSFPNLLAELPDFLQMSLQDIVTQIQIESHHYIKHPHHKNLELPDSVFSRFQELPLEIRNQHLRLELRNLIYGIYYNGSAKTEHISDIEKTNSAPEQNLENNSLFGVDLEFYDRLHRSNKGVGYWSHNWLVVKQELDGILVVQKNGLTLHIPDNIYLAQKDLSATVGNLVTIKMPKNLVQSAFYMAISNMDSPGENLARIYFNLTPNGAVAVMEDLTVKLNELGINFSFKALNNPTTYGRYDSAVLYFEKNKYTTIYPILTGVYQENKSHFYPQVPLFTKFLAPGLACAEEPKHKFSHQESFGTHRCQIVANALLDAWRQEKDTPKDRILSILQHFSSSSIKLTHPYLNPDSVDIYTPLNL
jgi:hypothetical protein